MTFRFMNCKLSIQKRPKYEEKIFVAIQLSTKLRFIKYDLRKLTKETKAIVLQIYKETGNELKMLFHAYNMLMQVQSRKYGIW